MCHLVPEMFNKVSNECKKGVQSVEEEKNKQTEITETDVAPVTETKEKSTEHCTTPVPFMSSFFHTMDAKGRMVIPSEFREMLGETFYVCPSPDFSTIALYTEEKWNERNELYLYVSEHSAMLEDEIKWFYSLSFRMKDYDSQGRILLPAILRQWYLKDERDIVITGAQQYISIMPNSESGRGFANFLATRNDTQKLELTKLKNERAEKIAKGQLKHD